MARSPAFSTQSDPSSVVIRPEGARSLSRTLLLSVIVLFLLVPACQTGGPRGETLRVMTFNIFHDRASPPNDLNLPGWDGRRDLVAETIRSRQPDIVGLQEALVWQVEWLVSQLPDYRSVGRGRDAARVGESVAILYRREKFDLLDSGEFWFSDTPEVAGSISEAGWGTMTYPRMTTWGRFRDRKTGWTFYAFNTHLASDGTGGSLSRDRSVRMLAQRIASRAYSSEPFVLTGDFNAIESDFPIVFLTSADSGSPIRAVDSWRAKPSGTRGTRCSNIPGADSGLRIDYILGGCARGRCAEVLEAAAIRHGNSCASDHLAVAAVLRY